VNVQQSVEWCALGAMPPVGGFFHVTARTALRDHALGCIIMQFDVPQSTGGTVCHA